MSIMPSFDPLRKRLRIRRKESHVFQPANPRPQRRDCHGRLLAAIEAIAGEGTSIDHAGMRPWCSATFIGAQHCILLRMSDVGSVEQSEAMATRLREAEYLLPGHIVADVAVDEIDHDAKGCVLSLAVLTIEDW
jgi:hypothetical protein